MAETKRMTAEQVVSYLLEGEEGLDFLRESLAWVVQQLMEAEVSELIGAERGERSEERLTHRNGYRSRRWDTRAGELELAIPKIRRGSYFPSFLEPRRRSEQALVSVVQEAYVAGVSTRKVDQVVESLGLRISKSEVSRICEGLDEQVDAFRNRPLEGRYPYLWLDAKVEKVRDGGRVVRKALVLAYGVHESGYREVIGLDVGEAETEAFWRSFLRSLVERGLSGVAAGRLRRARRSQEGDRASARLPLAALHACTSCARRSGTPARSSRGCWPRCCGRSSTPTTGEHARGLVSDALERLRKPLPKIAALLGGGRGRPARLLQLPHRPLGKAPLHEPARTGQPRDRPTHRRRRHLPQRPLPDPPRDQRRDRTKRRMARRTPLPQRPLAGDAPRQRKRRERPGGGARTHRGLSHRPCRRVTPRPGT